MSILYNPSIHSRVDGCRQLQWLCVDELDTFLSVIIIKFGCAAGAVKTVWKKGRLRTLLFFS